MAQSVFLTDFRSILPKVKARQGEAIEWLANAHTRSEIAVRRPSSETEEESTIRRVKKTVLRFGSATDRIQYRSSCLDDFLHSNWQDMRIFSVDTHPAGKSASERSRFFSEIVDEVFRRFYAEEREAPEILMHVTCTGYVSPSGAQRVVATRGWERVTSVLHSYHMGCYAALPSIRIAWGQTGLGKRRIDLVHTELCTLHLNPTQRSPEQLVVQTLFADGFIRYSVVPDRPQEGGMEVITLHEEIIPESEKCMGWMAAEHGMEMILSREVPSRISAELPGFLTRLIEPTGKSLDSLLKEAVFAIHPGGPKIIDHIQEQLGLSSAQVAASNAILANHGNMSSATLPHIWKHILDDETISTGTFIISLAFGPGLTISGAVLRKVK